MRRLVKNPAWFKTVKVGDVLQSPSGDYRVVRAAQFVKSQHPNRADKLYLVFAIRRCSWTGRCVTMKVVKELRDWIHTGHRVKLDTSLDRKIAKDLEYGSRLLGCCDVKYAL